MWNGQRWCRYQRSSSLSCAASGRGGVLESELIGDTIGKLNIICVVTTNNILIPLYMFTLAYLTLMTADCGWDTVVLVRARFLVFLLVLLSFVMLGRPMWRRVSCKQQLNRMSDLSRKLECFGHAVVEPCCCGVSCALWRRALSSFQL